MKLENKVAVITGGSRGIGYATAEAFLKEGATVVITASTQENADRAKDKLQKEYPDSNVRGISPKLWDKKELEAALNKVKDEFGKLDILVNNAGVSDQTPFVNYDEEGYHRVLDLNVKAVIFASQVAAEIMTEQGSGVILNTSSMVSQYGQPTGILYPVSKVAVDGITLSLARELGPKGIRVNSVAPGITETDMMKAVPKEVIEPLIAQIPLRRLGQPEDIANAFVFLASDDASYITGTVLRVDGLARS